MITSSIRRKTLSVKLFLLCATAFLSPLIAVLVETTYAKEPSSSPAGTSELVILHINDTHAHLEPWTFKAGDTDSVGGYARLAFEVKRLETKFPHALFLHAGDVFQGTIFFNKFGGLADRDCFESLGLTAQVLGNHEFDRGPEGLSLYAHAATWPLLSANVSAPDTALWFSDHVRPYLIVDVPDAEGVAHKVGIIGLTTPEVSQLATFGTSPGVPLARGGASGWHVAPVDSIAQALVDTLEARGINEIVALTHLGFDADTALAHRVRGIDVIVGGHSHTAMLDPYPVRTKSWDRGPVYIVQAGSWGQYLGELHVRFRNGRADSAWGRPHEINRKVPEDPTVAAIVARYAAQVREERAKVVATLPEALYGEVDSLRFRETTLGNLTADAMLHAVAGGHIDIAIGNAGGIRRGFAKGPVTAADMEEAYPFDNVVVACTTSGAQMRADLEQALEQYAKGKGRFPILSGLRMTLAPERTRFHRVLKLEWWEEDDHEWEPFYDSNPYGVAINDFMAQGGDGYTMCVKGWHSTGVALRDAVTTLLNDPKALEKARPSGRLLFKSVPVDSTER